MLFSSFFKSKKNTVGHHGAGSYGESAKSSPETRRPGPQQMSNASPFGHIEGWRQSERYLFSNQWHWFLDYLFYIPTEVNFLYRKSVYKNYVYYFILMLLACKCLLVLFIIKFLKLLKLVLGSFRLQGPA